MFVGYSWFWVGSESSGTAQAETLWETQKSCSFNNTGNQKQTKSAVNSLRQAHSSTAHLLNIQYWILISGCMEILLHQPRQRRSHRHMEILWDCDLSAMLQVSYTYIAHQKTFEYILVYRDLPLCLSSSWFHVMPGLFYDFTDTRDRFHLFYSHDFCASF